MSNEPRDTRPSMIGRHLLADLYGVAPTLLMDERHMLEVMLSALRDARFNVVSHLSHRFPGAQAGVTAVVLLSESHATFHTYPEHSYVALDVFSCGTPDPDAVLAAIVEALRPDRVHTCLERRGDRLRPYSTDSNGMSSAVSASSAARLP